MARTENHIESFKDKTKRTVRASERKKEDLPHVHVPKEDLNEVGDDVDVLHAVEVPAVHLLLGRLAVVGVGGKAEDAHLIAAVALLELPAHHDQEGRDALCVALDMTARHLTQRQPELLVYVLPLLRQPLVARSLLF